LGSCRSTIELRPRAHLQRFEKATKGRHGWQAEIRLSPAQKVKEWRVREPKVPQGVSVLVIDSPRGTNAERELGRLTGGVY
jgi:hypothetical protein